MSIPIGGNDPIKGLIAICEHLATKGLMNQAEFDEFVRKMNNTHDYSKEKPEKKLPSYNNCGNCTHNFFERLIHFRDHKEKKNE